MQKIREHDIEPVPGLPERLPQGEHIVWQGRPSARRIARDVMKVHWIAVYFLGLIGWAVAAGVSDGRSGAEILFSAGVLGVLAAIVIFLVELYAWGVQRTSLYTVTNKRLAMRVGVASSVTFNLPFTQVAGAALSLRKDATGDIAFEIANGGSMSWFHLWPHVRPRHWSKAKPALRCIPAAAQVAAIVVAQLEAAQGRESAGETAAPSKARASGARTRGAAAVSTKPAHA